MLRRALAQYKYRREATLCDLATHSLLQMCISRLVIQFSQARQLSSECIDNTSNGRSGASFRHLHVSHLAAAPSHVGDLGVTARKKTSEQWCRDAARVYPC
jgi:hypothetical protein